MAKRRRRSPPLPSCYRSSAPGNCNGNDKDNNDQDTMSIRCCGERTSNPLLPYVEHHDGRRFWSDRFYLHSHEHRASKTQEEVRHSNSPSNSNSHSDCHCECECDCGSLQAPPTFPLVDFVNRSLRVRAAVMGTFNLHPEWFRQSFPNFGQRRRRHCNANEPQQHTNNNNSKSSRERKTETPSVESLSSESETIPTFILHGHRGLEKALAERVMQADQVIYDTDREEDEETHYRKDSSIPKGTAHTSRSNHPILDESRSRSSSKFQFFLPATEQATETARDFVDNPDLQLCQVHCNWEPPKRQASRESVSVSTFSVLDKENSEKDNRGERNNPNNNTKTTTTTTTTTTTRQTKFGVHHPKFFLLFEESGDLVVIVTTSNLTPTNPSTVEGSWVQRFRRRRPGSSNSALPALPPNDFGPVLQDFLVQLSEAAAAGAEQLNQRNGGRTRSLQVPLTPNANHRLPLEAFLSKHIGLTSLSEFSSLYHFETAQTYLVPIVPGDYKYDPNTVAVTSTPMPASCFYYGRQRVRYILDKLATCTPTISKQTRDKSKSDRLLLQPTSLGNEWSRSQFAALIREYMGYYGGHNNNKKKNQHNVGSTRNGEFATKRKKSKTQQDHSYHRDDFWVCRQADIVWPSDRFMVSVAKSVENDDAVITPLQAATRKGGTQMATSTRVMNSFVFNSSRTFNACDFEFLARMAHYQPSAPCQFARSSPTSTGSSSSCSSSQNVPAKSAATAKAPHFKSIARVFPNHVAMQKRDVPPSDAYFSWFLLTSACLSLGAQGAAMEDEDKTSTASTVAYRNFELGVLFASHLPKKRKKGLSLSSMDSSLQDGKETQRESVVYCFHPHRCSCLRGSKEELTSPNTSTPRLVHLPVPYQLRPESYFPQRSNEDEDDDEGDDTNMTMQENPFFHEICDESRCIGNMLLTPFGQGESEQTGI